MPNDSFTFIIINMIIGTVIMSQKRLPNGSTAVTEVSNPSRIVKVDTLNVNHLSVNNLETNNLVDRGLISELQVYGDNVVVNYFINTLLTRFDSGDILTGDEVEAALAMIDILQLILL